MTEQDEKQPLTTDDAKSWLAAFKDFIVAVKDIATTLRGWLALAMIIWAAINIKDVKQIGNETKDVAVEAAEKSVESKAVATETLAKITYDPKDIAAAKEAKAEAQAATQTSEAK